VWSQYSPSSTMQSAELCVYSGLWSTLTAAPCAVHCPLGRITNNSGLNCIIRFMAFGAGRRRYRGDGSVSGVG